ncbi:hypothetical protein ABZS86_13335 [Streptomyces sp. NPDC005355]
MARSDPDGGHARSSWSTSSVTAKSSDEATEMLKDSAKATLGKMKG